MTGTTDTHIGQFLYIATALPATNNTAGFDTLTWVLVGGLQTLPQLGVSHSITDIEDLTSGFTSGAKGAAKGVDTSMTFREVASDTGQDNLKTVAESQGGLLSVKIVTGSGTDNAPVTGDPVEYAQGIAHSYQPNQGSLSSNEGFTASFRQNDFTVKGTEPA
ncbi:MAG: hypothetical protein COA78_32830 [Blastopirellula sp.]|nr:MAG: hypothetical protein COA78_32830 [Blastopirellula sp.]